MNVLIADDHPLFLAGVRDLLGREEGFDVIGEARYGPEVLPLVSRLHPDLLLLDLRMPGLDGLACLERVRARHPKLKVVVLSMCAEPEQIQAAFKRGACGYVLKSIDANDLTSAIRQAVDGTAYHAFGLPALNEDTSARLAGLTEREIEIVKAVARGLSSQAIGKELWVTEQTVKFHLTNIYRKLNVSNRTEAARWAFSQGFVAERTADLAS
ncbi:MAG TPA: response regulator transcription factor [Gaiellaceae bacterium]|jgi:DNA-binding NarL/FixJ family response regulator|nr:response regulator transcription factor [Gaiellaceae bacterium]